MSLKNSSNAFTKRDLELFKTYSTSVSIIVKNFQLITANRGNMLQTLKAFVTSIDAKDNYTKNHSQNISNIAGLIAYRYGLNEQDTENIMIAGLVHDIGKIGTPDQILLKKDSLSQDEWETMRQHVEIGHRILLTVPFLKDAAEIVYSHHERYDGSGYPNGQKDQQIPLGARIFAVVDVFDALTSDRSYHKKITCPEAQEIIKEERGKQFDPMVVDALLKISCAQWNQIDRHVSDRSASLIGIVKDGNA